MALSKILPASQEQYAGARNLIINGSMICSQRGVSSGSISSNGYSSLDRWYVNASGGTYTLSQEDFTVGQTDVPDFPKHYMRFAVTTGDNNIGVHQRVEDVTVLGGKTVTLSFWAKGTNPDGGSFVSSWIQNFGSGGSSSVETEVESGIVLTSSWQKFNITFDVPSVSGKTIGAGSFTWVELLRQPGVDTGTGGWTADIAQVQLELGSIATPFEHRSYGDELRRCQRYYQKSDVGFAAGSSSYNYTYYTNIPFKATMRATPTMTASAFGSDTGNAYTVVGSTTHNGWILQAAGTEGAYVRGSTGNTIAQIYGRGKFDAEL